jgi:hypothetical protein
LRAWERAVVAWAVCLLVEEVVDAVLGEAEVGEDETAAPAPVPGGRSVVAAVSVVAVLFALECPSTLALGAVEDGRPPDEVGRLVLVEGTLLLTPADVGAFCCC